MSATVIKVENLGKQYRLGDIGTGTISHDLNRWWAKVRGKEDPFLKLGEVNDRALKGTSDLVWALKNISFDIKQGDILGIIGKNGAGKSTLLKILSRTTKPTVGSYKIKGRIASLLEVGTGFHPELTGRENIYLNGAILGMTKSEIKKNFDAIVDFSGVERYIDTPVKRYSSGMYVRLAFAVAAHLESEILILDEVLAVGDLEFQRKCLGKIKDVSGEGRTVLFVSHNIGAVLSLCNKALILRQGQVLNYGNTDSVVNEYLNDGVEYSGKIEWKDNNAPGNEKLRIKKIELINNGIVSSLVDISKETTIRIYYQNFIPNQTYQIAAHLLDSSENYVFCSLNAPSAGLNEDKFFFKPYPIGLFMTEFRIPANFLNQVSYHINVILTKDLFHSNEVFLNKIISFITHDTGNMKKEYSGNWDGIIRPKIYWNTEQIVEI